MKESKKTVVTKSNKGMVKKLLIVVLALVFVGSIGLNVKQYLDNKDLKKNPPQVSVEEENKRVLEAVAKLYKLPDEAPSDVGKITNKDELKDEFFTDAQNGDYLLLFKNAKLAIIYRESEGRIIKSGPLIIPINVTIYANEGVSTKTVESAIAQAESVSITTKKTTLSIASPIVVDVTGNNKSAAEKIATLVAGKVGALPEGENAPEGAEVIVYLASPVAAEPAPTTEEVTE